MEEEPEARGLGQLSMMGRCAGNRADRTGLISKLPSQFRARAAFDDPGPEMHGGVSLKSANSGHGRALRNVRTANMSTDHLIFMPQLTNFTNFDLNVLTISGGAITLE